jgi:hypothetical protein
VALLIGAGDAIGAAPPISGWQLQGLHQRELFDLPN